MTTPPTLFLGLERPLEQLRAAAPAMLPAHHLTTHGVVVGMTGSGKTGLLVVMVEEALRAGVSCLVVDVKGDLANLLLPLPIDDVQAYLPWVESMAQPGESRTAEALATELATRRAATLADWGIDAQAVRAYAERVRFRLLTPGASTGEAVHLLATLEQRSPRWDDAPEAASAALGAAVSLVLRLVGRDPDPARSREHVLLALLAERRHRLHESAELPTLIGDLADPPFETVGALPVDDFLPRAERKSLAAALNALLASPSFAAWRTGAAIDPAGWLAHDDRGRPTCAVLSVAHLDDEERTLVLGMVLEEIASFTRTLSGTARLRYLLAFDEAYGFLPPHPHAPPTKRPLVTLLKQGRAFGFGVLIATQNPMDLDYRALSNAGLWFVGRLQTDADRARVAEGLCTATTRGARGALSTTLKRLGPRSFLVRDARRDEAHRLLQAREALSFLRGPFTRAELARCHRARRA